MCACIMALPDSINTEYQTAPWRVGRLQHQGLTEISRPLHVVKHINWLELALQFPSSLKTNKAQKMMRGKPLLKIK